MLGVKVRQTIPVSAVSLEDLVPHDHFYRHLEQVLDLSFVRQWVQDGYAANGRPSSDPVVFFKLQLVMFFEGVRSERHLMRLVADRLSVRWYSSLQSGRAVARSFKLDPHSHALRTEVFRRFFDAVVEQCQHAGLVWGRELYFDATQVYADAALDSLTTCFAVEARAPLQAHLAALFPEEMSLQVAQATPDQDHLGAAPSLAQPTPPEALPVVLSDAQREDLAATNATRHDWIAKEGRQQREVHGVYQRTADASQRRRHTLGLPDALCRRRRKISHIVCIRSYDTVLAEYRTHPEMKSLGPTGEVCSRQTVGLLQRRPVTRGRLTYAGKESNKLEEVGAGLIHDPDEVSTEYVDADQDPWLTLVLPILKEIPLRVIQEQTGLSRSQIKALRNGHAVPRLANREGLLRAAGGYARKQLQAAGKLTLRGDLEACAAYLSDHTAAPGVASTDL